MMQPKLTLVYWLPQYTQAIAKWKASGTRAIPRQVIALGWHTSLAALRTKVMPFRLRGKVSAIARACDRAWDKPEKYIPSDFLTHEQVFREVVQCSEHSTRTGTMVKVGNIKVINAANLKPSEFALAVNAVSNAISDMARIGLSEVCYGRIVVTRQVRASGTSAAFYNPDSDTVFVRVGDGLTRRTICHELAHRYEYTCNISKTRLIQLYLRISRGTLPAPPIGRRFTFDDGSTFLVKAIDRAAQEVVLTKEPDDGFEYPFPLRRYATRETPEGIYFICKHAEENPSENFAEMVAAYAVGRLPKQQIQLLRPLFRRFGPIARRLDHVLWSLAPVWTSNPNV